MIHGALFDFSGTLFRFEPGPGWPSTTFDESMRERLTTVLTSPTRSADHLPPDLADAWARRDLDPEVHRTVYLASLASTGFALSEEETELVYRSLTAPDAWQPYPDTADVLRGLAAAGVPVAVVSNIAWDIRPMFRKLGVEDLVTEFVLSYVEGVVKPDPKIFTIACQRIGVAPEQAVMVGDSPEADGGASAIGCRTVIVDPAPTATRRSALREAVAEVLPAA
ncbi:HAD family hydrolase [Actinophytocola sp. KF-1]